MKEPAVVRLTVFDMLGREVAILADGIREAGYHILTWQAGENSAGTYVVHLTASVAGKEALTRSMKVLLAK